VNGTIELSPDQLAQLVCAVMEANGMQAHGLALHLGDQLVGFDRAVIHYKVVEGGIEVYPKPQSNLSRQQLEQMLRPDVNPTFASRSN
jgi:hypothetical protein